MPLRAWNFSRTTVKRSCTPSFDHITAAVKKRDFLDAEKLQNWLIKIDSLPVSERIHPSEVIAREKVNLFRFSIWELLSESQPFLRVPSGLLRSRVLVPTFFRYLNMFSRGLRNRTPSWEPDWRINVDNDCSHSAFL